MALVAYPKLESEKVMTDKTTEPDPELVWRICPYVNDGEGERECSKCPPNETWMGRQNCSRGCYLLAREVVNIVQTGDPHRKVNANAES